MLGLFFQDLFVVLKSQRWRDLGEKRKDREREKGREIFHSQFTSQVTTVATAGPLQNCELGLSSGTPMLMQGPET